MEKEPFHRHNFVISTGAYPDFPLRDAGKDHVCGSP
jgi:hypothetical protein